MEENVYKKARLRAAKKNPHLKTAEKAHAQLYMTREKLLMVEQSDPTKKQTIPDPSDVVAMAEAYDAPELRDYYCTHHCPIGSERKPLLHDNLSEISTGLMAALYFLGDINSKIHRILADSQVTEEEKKEFAKSLKVLREIAYNVNSLELWAEKNNLIED